MKLQILTPEKSIYSGEVDSVKVPGNKGSFEILNNHAPIISSLEQGKIRIKNKSETKLFEIKSGFVEVLNNDIVILVEGSVEVTK